MAPRDKSKKSKKTSYKNDSAPKESQANPSSPVPMIAPSTINHFSPTHFPKNLSGPLPESLLKSFNQSLSVGTKMNFNAALNTGYPAIVFKAM